MYTHRAEKKGEGIFEINMGFGIKNKPSTGSSIFSCVTLGEKYLSLSVFTCHMWIITNSQRSACDTGKHCAPKTVQVNMPLIMAAPETHCSFLSAHLIFYQSLTHNMLDLFLQ